MSLGNNEKRIYLGISEGKIVKKVDKDTEGAVKRTKKDGTDTYELIYGNVSGAITDISTKTTQYQGNDIKSWVVQLSDVGENYQLEINYDSAYAKSFLKSLLNPALDVTSPVTITPWQKVVDGKKKSAIYLSQGSEQVDWFFTKDQPNGLPPLVAVKIKGKDSWDDYDQMQFFEEQVKEKIKSKLGHQTSAAFKQPEPVDDGGASAPDDDDLPF